ncbi:MAG: response regulator, partial [Flavisolibacter sp.]|nr:response regulator [Flavisolibacter sp.]
MTVQQPFILVVDDDSDDSDLLCSALEKIGGLKIECIEFSYEVISKLKYCITLGGELPTLIIIDYNMPRINGHELLLLIKNEEHLKKIPVVVYSTCITQKMNEIFTSLGAAGCYVKSSNYTEII